MEEKNNGVPDASTQETAEETAEETTEETPKLSEEEIAELKKEADLARNYRIRAEKAEKKLKEEKEEGEDTIPAQKKQDKDDNLSSKDLYALMEAKVPQDDVDEVIKAAKLLGKSIPEVLKDSLVIAKLEKNAEIRKTADATNTKSTRAGAKKISDADLLKSFSEGNAPEPGSEEAERLFWLRKGVTKK